MTPPVTMLAVPIVSRMKPQKIAKCMTPARASRNIRDWAKPNRIVPHRRATTRSVGETGRAAARIERERGLGPWSAGMICLHGLGRYEQGLVGDLGLVKLCTSLLGRRAEPEDTARLALKADRAEADGVFISCTNLPTAPIIERLENELGKPVVTSNQATLWLGLRALLPVILLASIQGSVVGLLLLLAGRAQPGPAAAPPAPGGEGGEGEDDWIPPRNAIPFGPFLVAGALEWLYLAAPLAALVPALDVFR